MHPPLPTVTGPKLGQRFAQAHPDFATPVQPTPVPRPQWLLRNLALGEQLGLPHHWLDSDEALAVLSGNAVLQGSAPSASVYSGHQFGAWAGQLGDGRALMLGDWSHQGLSTEIQLKGAGPTPYSRRGDGRAVLRSSLREYLASEAMHALGVPTTRALALVHSPLTVYRERPETAAIVTRTAPSFVRFGHFEHFAHHGMPQALDALIAHVCTDLWPDLSRDFAGEERTAAMLARVAQRSAELVAAWQCMGFCHGVLNTDNMSVLGLALDYGPYQWMDAHIPDHICNHSDSYGRYAYAQQPSVVHWNLQALAVALSASVEREQVLADALSVYAPHYAQHLRQTMANKLGLGAVDERAVDLIHRWFDLLAEQGGDHTLSHRAISEALRDCTGDWTHMKAPPTALAQALRHASGLSTWWADATVVWRAHSDTPEALGLALCAVNPRFVLRNHMAQEAIENALEGDTSVANRLLHVLQNPFDTHVEEQSWSNHIPPWAAGLSISCSS